MVLVIRWNTFVAIKTNEIKLDKIHQNKKKCEFFVNSDKYKIKINCCLSLYGSKLKSLMYPTIKLPHSFRNLVLVQNILCIEKNYEMLQFSKSSKFNLQIQNYIYCTRHQNYKQRKEVDYCKLWPLPVSDFFVKFLAFDFRNGKISTFHFNHFIFNSVTSLPIIFEMLFIFEKAQFSL